MSALENILSEIFKKALDDEEVMYRFFGSPEHTELLKAIQEKNLDALKKVVIRIKEKYGISIETLEPVLFSENSSIPLSEKECTNCDESSLDSLKIQALLSNNPNDEIILMNSDIKISWEDIKQLAKDIYLETSRCVIFIPNSEQLKGKILSELYVGKVKIFLAGIYRVERKGETSHELVFFDEKVPKTGEIVKYIDYDFYTYLFETEDEKKYILLSFDKLPKNPAIVKGISFFLSEKKLVGESAKLPSRIPVLLVNKCIDLLEIPSEKEFLDCISKFNDYSELCKRVFGSVQYPEWFSKLIFTWLFSGRFMYPLHLFILGRAGTFKSTLLDCIGKIFGENIATGSGTTIKGLIPSFKSTPPDIGHLIKAKRLALVDEFLKMIARERRHGREDEITILSVLNDLLEHRERDYVSGSGKLPNVKMNAKCLFASNPFNKYQNLLDVVEELDDTFLSRFLIVWHDKAYMEYMQRQKETEIKTPQQMDPEFIRITDFLQNYSVKLDLRKITEIFNELKKEVPEQLISYYDARFHHHIKCIVDGLAKLRGLLQHKIIKEAEDEDYENARELLLRIIYSWLDIELTDVPLKARKYYLPFATYIVYDFIEKHRGLSKEELSKLVNDLDIDSELKRLIEIGLIKQKDGKYYPYWYTFKESDVNDLAEKYNFEEIKKESEIEGKEGKKHIIPDYAVKCFLEKYEAVEEIVLIEFLRYCGFKKPEELIAYYISQHIIFRDNEGKLRLV